MLQMYSVYSLNLRKFFPFDCCSIHMVQKRCHNQYLTCENFIAHTLLIVQKYTECQIPSPFYGPRGVFKCQSLEEDIITQGLGAGSRTCLAPAGCRFHRSIIYRSDRSIAILFISLAL